MDGLCSGCFNAHFPQPNMKICKLKQETNRNSRKKRVENAWPPRLRGGADNAEGDTRMHSMLINRAIESAKNMELIWSMEPATKLMATVHLILL